MKTLDFDKFISEKKREKIEITVYGEKIVIDAFIPAIVPIMMARAESTNDSSAAVRMVMIAADALLGEKNVNRLCQKGMSSDELSSLVGKLFNMINGVDAEDSETEEISDEDSRKAVRGKNAKK